MFSIIFCCLLLIYLTYRYLISNYRYWEKRNVPFENPILFFGNIKDVVFMRKSFAQCIGDIGSKYPNSPYIGFYKMRTPCLLLTNPEDITQAFIHDSDFFMKNEFTIDEEVDAMAAKSPFFLIGQKWRKSRGLFTPLLSPAKLKHVTPFLVQATKKMITYIEEHKLCEARDLLSRYVADASALSVFGIDGESFDKDDAFYRSLGQKLMEPSGFTGLKLLCMVFMPSLAKFLHLKFLPDDSIEFIRQTISAALKHRKENNINNNDFLDSIMALKSDTFTENDIALWSFSFFSEPNTSNQGSYILYALAANPEIQKKLKAEIDDVLSRYNEKITYEAIQDMSYLDCVVSETLRMYPTLGMYMKRCTGYYEFPLNESQNEVISLEPGMSLAASIMSLHHNEKYFENAMEFIPERFSEKNRGNIHKGTYIPFGMGKRICPGMKFATLLMKIATVVVVKEFEITVNEKTKDPFDVDPKYVMSVPKSRIWIDFNRRD